MRIDPKDPRPYFFLSQTQAEAGNYERAEKVLVEAQRFTSYTGEAYNMLGVARVEGGGVNSALEAQRTAIAESVADLEKSDHPHIKEFLELDRVQRV